MDRVSFSTESSAQMPSSQRRSLLKLLAGTPMLPLGGTLAATVLAGCGGGDDSNGAAPASPSTPAATMTSASFVSMAAPDLTTPNAMATCTVGSQLKVSFSDGSSRTFKLGYQPFFLTGDKVPDGNGGTLIAGGIYDINNRPLMDTSVPGKERQFFSDCPDGTSLLTVPNAKVPGVKGNPVFAVVQFEYTDTNLANTDKTDQLWAELPSPIAVLTLDQDPTTGKLSLVKYHNVDTTSVHGLWVTCGASLSPWGTHLSSEEYEPDAFRQGLGGATTVKLDRYSANLYGDASKANPYHYGHIPEVTVNPDGTGSIKKHYCMGRFSHELIQMMPDERTALMGDDATNGGWFMFVADKARDLSSGTLYVAHWTEKFTDTSTAAMQWIKLGSATSAEIEAMINGGIKPTDIMDSVTTDPNDSSYTRIVLNKDNTKCWVRVKPGMEKAAAFLETHRYAALKGGSLALTKSEGVTVNVRDKVAYSVASSIRDSMVVGAAGYVESHNVAFPKRVNAGAILAHDLTGGQKDTAGNAINSDWVPKQSRVLLMGEDIPADLLGNTANPEKIASPDNIKFSEGMRTLFIGEDTTDHVNNFLWAYNVDTKQLSRVLSTPSGAESTGLHAVDSINGWTYIMSNFQHAGDWQSVHSKVKDTLDPIVRKNYNDRFSAAVGYLTATDAAISFRA
ncbi:PhoX family protein [Paracidovorax wautersii]|uniref:Alkaline phosphatase n=1 Tax=Paracidovorax wautersii TaxID=1177982 RepID=A0A1I2DCB7_9BURK|nr:alkaline phosphatase PhoX [Paracidovorax wautersii]SFE78215.1 hypothetical protein SAMN04489711_105114 [Paracidovorax wautersii]